MINARLKQIVKLKSRISEIESEIEKIRIDSKKKLMLIENGAKFGQVDSADFDMFTSYFKCELIEVLDREQFLIKVLTNTNEVKIDEVCNFEIIE